MTDARPQLLSGGRNLRLALLLPAAALIFLGSVIQLGVLGYGQLNPHDFWPVMMIFQSAWNLFASCWSGPEWAGISQFWPLLLVVSGLSILFLLKPASRKPVSRTNRWGA